MTERRSKGYCAGCDEDLPLRGVYHSDSAICRYLERRSKQRRTQVGTFIDRTGPAQWENPSRIIGFDRRAPHSGGAASNVASEDVGREVVAASQMLPDLSNAYSRRIWDKLMDFIVNDRKTRASCETTATGEARQILRDASAAVLEEMANDWAAAYNRRAFPEVTVADYGKPDAETFVSRNSAAMGRHLAGVLRARATQERER